MLCRLIVVILCDAIRAWVIGVILYVFMKLGLWPFNLLLGR